MNQREKVLAFVVGILVVAGVAFVVLKKVGESFDARHREITSLEQAIRKKKLTLRLGERASKHMQNYELRSLPADPTLAQSAYQAWLLDKTEKDVKFQGVNVRPLPGRMIGDVYYQHVFQITCAGDLQQLTEFLHAFYQVDYLHRISRLYIKPLSNSQDLNLNVTVEALSIRTAPPREKMIDLPSQRLAHEGFQPYEETIVYRNLFGPANQPPRLVSMGTQQGNPNRSLTFRVQGEDPDEADGLRYSLAGDIPQGASIDETSGEFRWTPAQNGEYFVTVRVSDDRRPPKTDEGQIKIEVVDPPPPPPPAPVAPRPPEFDVASLAVVTGITEINGRRLLFVTLQSEGRILKLLEGDQLAIGTLKGTITRIGDKDAEIKTEDGSVIVKLGNSLRPFSTGAE